MDSDDEIYLENSDRPLSHESSTFNQSLSPFQSNFPTEIDSSDSNPILKESLSKLKSNLRKSEFPFISNESKLGQTYSEKPKLQKKESRQKVSSIRSHSSITERSLESSPQPPNFNPKPRSSSSKTLLLSKKSSNVEMPNSKKSLKSSFLNKFENPSENESFEILYHMTNKQSAEKIKTSQKMIPGLKGSYGPGIYFCENPRNCVSRNLKASESLVTAKVRLRNMAVFEEPQPSLTKEFLYKRNIFSVKGNPKYPEIAVYDSEDVEVLRIDDLREVLENEDGFKIFQEDHKKILDENYPDQLEKVNEKFQGFLSMENLNIDEFKIPGLIRSMKNTIPFTAKAMTNIILMNERRDRSRIFQSSFGGLEVNQFHSGTPIYSSIGFSAVTQVYPDPEVDPVSENLYLDGYTYVMDVARSLYLEAIIEKNERYYTHFDDDIGENIAKIVSTIYKDSEKKSLEKCLNELLILLRILDFIDTDGHNQLTYATGLLTDSQTYGAIVIHGDSLERISNQFSQNNFLVGQSAYHKNLFKLVNLSYNAIGQHLYRQNSIGDSIYDLTTIEKEIKMVATALIESNKCTDINEKKSNVGGTVSEINQPTRNYCTFNGDKKKLQS
jgi:hypothetical protein